jgi:CBS domain-containing protein
MHAKDIMKRKVIVVQPAMTVREVAQLFADKRISGAPVVDDNGRVIGVISQTDLVRKERESSTQEVPIYHREAEEYGLLGPIHAEDPDYTRVEQVMTPWAISADENTPVEELARLMLDKRIHRVVITRGGELCGLVTSMDMLRALLAISNRKGKHGLRGLPA